MSNLPRIDATTVTRPLPLEARWRVVLADYVALTKPRILTLLLLTTLTGMIVAASAIPSGGLILITLLAGALMAGGANAMNCCLERDLDARMSRTLNRPVAAHRIEPLHAALFSLALVASAFLLFARFVNVLSAVLSLTGFLVYVVVYTHWLKRTSPYSMLVGGIAGAVPPLVGWTAVTGRIELPALILFGIIVLWQAPHTLALSLMLQKDYARAGIPVMPVVQGASKTRRDIVLYTVLLVGVSAAPFVTGTASVLYLIVALVLGARFLQLSWNLLRDPERRATVRLYKFSLLYLALLFTTMAVDRLLIR